MSPPLEPPPPPRRRFSTFDRIAIGCGIAGTIVVGVVVALVLIAAATCKFGF